MFHLNPNSGVPIYRQLAEQVQRLVAGGHLRPGDQLPSVRELAMTHAVNPMTISKAYSLLEAEGVLVRQRGKPMAVAALQPRQTDPAQWLEEPLEQLVSAARELGLEDRELLNALRLYLRKN